MERLGKQKFERVTRRIRKAQNKELMQWFEDYLKGGKDRKEKKDIRSLVEAEEN